MIFKSKDTILDTNHLGTLKCAKCRQSFASGDGLYLEAWGQQTRELLHLNITHQKCPNLEIKI